MAGKAPTGWYESLPRDAKAWQDRLQSLRSEFAGDWVTRLAPAFAATGKAKERLEES